MARKPRKSATTKALIPVQLLPVSPIPGTAVVPEAVFTNKRHPSGPGPWADEPDKIAWTDPATGYGCLINREPEGHFGGYVGVEPGHPLHGYRDDALPPSIGAGLHNPVTYAEACDPTQGEAVSICHVSPERDLRSRRLVRVPHTHDDRAWWFGMLANGPRDFSPKGVRRRLAAERGEIYRDARFVYAQVVRLAAQLKAVEGMVLDHNLPKRTLPVPSGSLTPPQAHPAPEREDEQ